MCMHLLKYTFWALQRGVKLEKSNRLSLDNAFLAYDLIFPANWFIYCAKSRPHALRSQKNTAIDGISLIIITSALSLPNIHLCQQLSA